MKSTISGSEPFKVLKDTFCIGVTTAGYTLAYSTAKDGTFTDYPTPVPAGETCIVNGATPFMFFKLKDNNDEDVEIIL